MGTSFLQMVKVAASRRRQEADTITMASASVVERGDDVASSPWRRKRQRGEPEAEHTSDRSERQWMHMDFQWGRTADNVRIDGSRLVGEAISGVSRSIVGSALSAQACTAGMYSWTLRRVSKGSEGPADYVGVSAGTGINLGGAPTSSSFGGFVAGFRASRANGRVGGELRYGATTYSGSPSNLPSLEEDGSLLVITLDHEAGKIVFGSPGLRPHLGTIHFREEHRGMPLHLFVYLCRSSSWEVVESCRLSN